MFQSLNIKEVRVTIIISVDGTVRRDYHFDFADGSYGGLFANGQVVFHATVKAS